MDDQCEHHQGPRRWWCTRVSVPAYWNVAWKTGTDSVLPREPLHCLDTYASTRRFDTMKNHYSHQHSLLLYPIPFIMHMNHTIIFALLCIAFEATPQYITLFPKFHHDMIIRFVLPLIMLIFLFQRWIRGACKNYWH